MAILPAYHCQKIAHGSLLYAAAVALRYEVLRVPLRLNFTKQQLDSEATDHHFVAINEQKKVVATLLLSQTETENCLKMRQVAVQTAVQSTGVGSLLVAYAETWAKNQNHTQMVLNARETAIPFYLKNGYVARSEPFLEVGLVHKKMEKQL